MSPFFRTFKPMLKRARGTPSYPDVRLLVQLWLHCTRVQQLLHSQNTRLCEAASTRDRLLAVQVTRSHDTMEIR